MHTRAVSWLRGGDAEDGRRERGTREADEQQRAPGQRELREGARLALRPVCRTSSQKYAFVATARATARRRGGRLLDAAAARTAG